MIRRMVRRLLVIPRTTLVVLAAVATWAAEPVPQPPVTGTPMPEETPRPETWAAPVTLDGVHNLFRLTPTLYRCAQPDAAGMKQLEALGIRTVINLRAFHNDREESKGTTLLNEELSVKTWHIEDEDVIRVLRILKDPTRGPFVIHCLHGSDRTGLMCAMYRIVVQGWTRDQAIRELTSGGYGFWYGWSNILRYLREVDIERIRTAVAAP